MRSADSAPDARVPIIPILDPSRGMDVRSPLPLMLPLNDDDFSDFRSHGPISSIGAHPVHLLPVSPLTLAGRISQRTRSRTAAAQRLHRDDQHDGGEQFREPASSLNSCSDRESSVSSRAEPASNRVFVRSVMNFVIGDEWFCSVFKLKMGDSSKIM